jgi:hypothetical protein
MMNQVCRFLSWAGSRGVVLARYYEERGLSALDVSLDDLLAEFQAEEDVKKEPSMKELDGLVSTNGPTLDIWWAVERAIEDQKVRSLCMDVDGDRHKLYSHVVDVLKEEFQRYHSRLAEEYEWSLDNCNDIDSGVLLGVMNLMASWAGIDNK